MEIKTRKQQLELGLKFTDYVKPGDIVDEEMAEYFALVVAPLFYTDLYIQCGEEVGTAFDECFGHGYNLYYTFWKEDGVNWKYCGTCYRQGDVHEEHDDFALDKQGYFTWDLEAFKEQIVDVENETFMNKWKDKEKSGDKYEFAVRYNKFLNEFYNWRVAQEGGN